MPNSFLTFVLLLSCVPPVFLLERAEFLDVVSVQEVPFAVIVFCNNNKYFCSGSIIHQEWVLTSAHCLYNMNGVFTEDNLSVTVIAGTNRLNSSAADVKSGKAQQRQSVLIVVHEEYSWSENFVHDLALIQMKEPFTMTDRVNLAPVGRNKTKGGNNEAYVQSDDDLSMDCVGYGYGKVLSWQSNMNDYSLKAQHYEITKHCHCMEKVRSVRSPYNILRKKNIFLCDLKTLSSTEGLCMGDNGGQMMCEGRLRGVASTVMHFEVLDNCLLWQDRKNDCGSSQSLNVFTDLCYMSQWLRRYLPDYPLTDNTCQLLNSTAYHSLDK